MRRIITTAFGISTLLACGIAGAQNNTLQPAQTARPASTQIAQAAPAPTTASGTGVAAGTAGNVVVPGLGAVTTTAVAGTAIGLGVAAAVTTTSEQTTTGTK